MRNIVITLIFFLISFDANAIEYLDSVQSCDSHSNKFATSYIYYFNNYQNDSIGLIFDNWEKLCGNNEPLQRAKIIYHLYFNSFKDSILDDSISCYILKFQARKHSNYLNNEAYFSFVPINGRFDRFTDSIAKIVLKKYNKRSVEFFLSELYAHKSDSILIKIKSPLFKNSKIQKSPCVLLKKNKTFELNNKTIDLAAMAGLWIPTGDLSILGVHPQLGFQTGINKINFSIKFTFLIRFLNSPNDYYATRVKSDNLVEKTNLFFGPYVGIDYSRNIKRINRSIFSALIGLGFDAFQVLKENEKLEYGAEDARSYNFNLGLGYRYYFKNLNYIGFEAKYNIVDYTLRKSINLTGDFISLVFIYGFVEKIK